MIGFTVDSVAQYCTPEIFAEKVSSGEIEYWMDHVIAEVNEKTKDPSWQRTGMLEQHDAFIINPCISMFQHYLPLMLAFEKGFFQVFHDFLAAIKAPMLPCEDVANTVCLLVSNAFAVSTAFTKTTAWTPEKLFKKMESCGMLEQFIRCSIIPPPRFPHGIDRFYDELTKCTLFIKKKFKRGQPCGDVVRAILEDKDGHKKTRLRIVKKLEAIDSFADYLQPSEAALSVF